MKRKKILLISILFFVIILIVAFFTRPDDKKIKIEVVDAIWQNRVPNMYSKPEFYESFMNLTTQDIDIDDWFFLKRIKYTIHAATTIGYAAFGKVMLHK